MDKINAIIFGFAGLDTAPIVREIRKKSEFGIVKWFGASRDPLSTEADFNNYEFYKFQADYDYRQQLPLNFLETMQESLGNLLISSARRNEVELSGRVRTLSFGSTYEYLHHFWRYCYHIYNLITTNHINLIVIDGVPHTSIDILLCKAAQFFNIKLLFLYQPNIPNKFMYFSELKGRGVDFGPYFSDIDRPVKNLVTEYKVRDPEKPFYMTDFTHLFYDAEKIFDDLVPNPSEILRKAPKSGFIFSFARIFYENRDNASFLDRLANALLKFSKYALYDANLKKHSEKSPDLTKNYVYFPLSFQPELTTECLGGLYIDIISAIEKVRVLIPESWKIYVKDHLIQYEFARDQIFFDRLTAIPNLILVDRHFSSLDLIKNAQFVSSVNGTASWEAIHIGKNALNFGSIYYQGLPGVFQYSYDLKYDDIMGYKINTHHLEVEINKLISRMEDGVVCADYSAAVSDFDPIKNAQMICDFIVDFYFQKKKSIAAQCLETQDVST